MTGAYRQLTILPPREKTFRPFLWIPGPIPGYLASGSHKPLWPEKKVGMIGLWIGFIVFVIALLAIDLGLFHRHPHAIGIRESLLWSAFWVGLSLSFTVFIYFLYEYRLFGLPSGPGTPSGQQAAVLFLTGYVVEESLSMDNMFVIALILSYFAIPAKYQHRLLFWGILGALVLRGGMIAGGAALVSRFQWVLYLFGAFLIFSAIKLLWSDEDPDPARNPVLRLARRVLPISQDQDGPHFHTRRSGKWMLTPMALALVTVESADVVFAVDSIPAIFAITDVPFLVFTSNMFAILGLRSLYFALAGVMHKFHYLKVSLAILLGVIGLKMLLKDVLHGVKGLTFIMLGLVVVILGAGVLASVLHNRRHKNDPAA